MRDIMS